jgi:uncharacterized alkaline shock family protein YloU
MSHPGLELSQDVLYGIAQLALDGVEGVRAIAPPARVGEFLTGRRAKGIQITRSDDGVDVSLTVAMTYGERIPRVAESVQRAVREAVASMTGLTVRTVDVHVELVDLPTSVPERAAPSPKALPGETNPPARAPRRTRASRPQDDSRG